MSETLVNIPWRMRLDAATHDCVRWRPTTLRQIGRNEEFLEKLIAANPATLGLEDRRAQVHGPYVAFRQLALNTPQGRSVKPDVVFLTESGHAIVVEVKLCDNAELGDRRVVAQLLDYASSLGAYEEDDLAELFGAHDGESFAALVARIFPKAPNYGELAEVLLERIQSAELHLVIACDGAPEGLREFVRGVARQSALGAFELRVLELVPHVLESAPQELLLVPSTPARTEIVARTAVNITYQEGQPKPGVSVAVTSPDDVKEAIREARGASMIRPLLGAVVRAYDEVASTELKTQGRAANYRQIKVPGWPAAVHYELVSYGHGEVGIELHLENDEVGPLRATLEPFVATLRERFPQAVWEPAWSDGRGRIVVRVPASDPSVAAAATRDFISRTRSVIDDALGELRGRG